MSLFISIYLENVAYLKYLYVSTSIVDSHNTFVHETHFHSIFKAKTSTPGVAFALHMSRTEYAD